jgi:hypothetical protein
MRVHYSQEELWKWSLFWNKICKQISSLTLKTEILSLENWLKCSFRKVICWQSHSCESCCLVKGMLSTPIGLPCSSGQSLLLRRLRKFSCYLDSNRLSTTPKVCTLMSSPVGVKILVSRLRWSHRKCLKTCSPDTGDATTKTRKEIVVSKSNEACFLGNCFSSFNDTFIKHTINFRYRVLQFRVITTNRMCIFPVSWVHCTFGNMEKIMRMISKYLLGFFVTSLFLRSILDNKTLTMYLTFMESSEIEL